MHNDVNPDIRFLTARGELGTLILQFDWSKTPLGPISGWPQSLKTSVSLMLSSRQPMWIGWGPDATFLYNDAYIDVLSASKHPWALGRPAAEVWSEIWDICGPLADVVFKDGDATIAEDVRLFMNRGDFIEETYYSFSYSPIRDESGKVGGLFCPNLESTAKYLNARRLRTLSELATRSLVEKTVASTCRSAFASLADNADDVPFSLLYLADATHETVRITEHSHLPNLASVAAFAPTSIRLDDATADGAWPIAEVIRSGKQAIISVRDVESLPPGLASQRIKQAIVLPLIVSGQEFPIGALVAGVNPTRKIDDDYLTFYGLVGTQLANAIYNATAIEEEKTRADMLAEIDRAKTAFFSNVSHEFRTPLTLMLGPIEDALADVDERLGPAQQERVQLMQRNALRLQKLVNTLLEFSRIQAGRVEATFVPTDLAALTIDLASTFRSTIEHAGLSLVVDCAPVSRPVYVDPTMWEKIILNLLSNAFKFTFKGAISVTLRVSDSHAMVSIADTGIGIPNDELPQLFERFHRVEGSRARTHEGSGIGLALVQDLVALHGGKIDVDSEVDHGTTFTITIPIGPAHLDPERISNAMQSSSPLVTADAYIAEAERWTPTAVSRSALDDHADLHRINGPTTSDSPIRILVVDDNADMRDYLRRLLHTRWQVEAVTNGREALDSIHKQPPTLVISDVMMPELDGFGLLAALRADANLSEMPFILLSARAGEESRVEGLGAGADDYLVKPFSGRELIARIDSLIMRKRLSSMENAFAARLQSIFEQAPVAISITHGPEHVFELVNSHALTLIGHRQVIGLPLSSALPELEGQKILELYDSVFQSGKPYIGRSLRFEMKRSEDAEPEECFFNFVLQPLLNADGRPDGIAAVTYEVTDLLNAKRAAEKANRSKDEFLAMLGHELRNPLAPIITALQLMQLRGVTEGQKERAIIERQAHHLIALVNDLLDVSRVAQGKVQLHKALVETSDVVTKAIETASPLLEKKHHTLTIDVPATGLGIHADPERLGQVLSNLIMNSAKYTEDGGQIRVFARAEGRDVLISVIDNGIGIEHDMLPHIFDMFVQERQALNRSGGGLGLGLAIAKSMTELHDGTIFAASEGLGKGSTLTVRIPLVSIDSGGLVSQTRHHEFERIAPQNTGLTILIVDDNQDAARMLADTLTLLGHRTYLAFDGPSAINTARAVIPDVGLLDIGLPAMDGYELASQLRQVPELQGIRLFSLTGYGEDADRQRSLKAGFDEHIVKPVDTRRLEMLLHYIKPE